MLTSSVAPLLSSMVWDWASLTFAFPIPVVHPDSLIFLNPIHPEWPKYGRTDGDGTCMRRTAFMRLRFPLLKFQLYFVAACSFGLWDFRLTTMYMIPSPSIQRVNVEVGLMNCYWSFRFAHESSVGNLTPCPAQAHLLLSLGIWWCFSVGKTGDKGGWYVVFFCWLFLWKSRRQRQGLSVVIYCHQNMQDIADFIHQSFSCFSHGQWCCFDRNLPQEKFGINEYFCSSKKARKTSQGPF